MFNSDSWKNSILTSLFHIDAGLSAGCGTPHTCVETSDVKSQDSGLPRDGLETVFL